MTSTHRSLFVCLATAALSLNSLQSVCAAQPSESINDAAAAPRVAHHSRLPSHRTLEYSLSPEELSFATRDATTHRSQLHVFNAATTRVKDVLHNPVMLREMHAQLPCRMTIMQDENASAAEKDQLTTTDAASSVHDDQLMATLLSDSTRASHAFAAHSDSRDDIVTQRSVTQQQQQSSFPHAENNIWLIECKSLNDAKIAQTFTLQTFIQQHARHVAHAQTLAKDAHSVMSEKFPTPVTRSQSSADDFSPITHDSAQSNSVVDESTLQPAAEEEHDLPMDRLRLARIEKEQAAAAGDPDSDVGSLDSLQTKRDSMRDYPYEAIDLIGATLAGVAAWSWHFAHAHWGAMHKFNLYETDLENLQDTNTGIYDLTTGKELSIVESQRLAHAAAHLKRTRSATATSASAPTSAVHHRVKLQHKKHSRKDKTMSNSNHHFHVMSAQDDITTTTEEAPHANQVDVGKPQDDAATVLLQQQEESGALVWPRAPEAEVRLSIISDWASGTRESAYVAQLMMQSNPHYTLHLGDIYYVGTPDEVSSNMLGVAPKNVRQGVTFPHGTRGAFAISGNHEQMSRSWGFYETLLPTLGTRVHPSDPQNLTMSGQRAAYFVQENEHWRIVALDTGYSTYSLKFENGNVSLPKSTLDWLRDVVQIGAKHDKRGIILLTHHQPVSAFEAGFPFIAQQLAELIPSERTVLWLFGHEHRLSFYGAQRVPIPADDSAASTAGSVSLYARCMGNSGFPTELRPLPTLARHSHLLAFDDRVYEILSDLYTMNVGFNGWADIVLRGDQADLVYKSLSIDSQTRKVSNLASTVSVTETFRVDSKTGSVVQTRFNIVDKNVTIVDYV